MSIALCEFQKQSVGYVISPMQTASETRRSRLEMLIKRYESLAALNTALGWTRTDPKLAQIRNANPRPGRDKPYQMGDSMAREIEEKLGLERGWMDTLPSYDDPALDERIRHLHRVAESLTPYQIDQLIKIGATLAEPEPPAQNGTQH